MAQGKDQEIAELRRQLDELLSLIMNSAADLLGAETSSLLLLDDETGELTVEVATGGPAPAVEKQRVPPGVGIAGWVVENDEALVVDRPQEDARFYGGIDEKSGFETRNMLAVPLRTKERVIGAVEVINKREGGFAEKDVTLASALANQAATAIDNARLYARLADAVVTSRLSYRF